MTLSRRAFMHAGGLALFSVGLDPVFLDRAAYALGAPRRGATFGRTRTLVCLFQRGAVDGLSMVVPYADADYRRARPRIGLAPSSLLDLDGHFGLHPALKPLAPLWSNKSLAVVHAVGSPDTTRSHFDAQDYMETGTPGRKATPDGWLSRLAAHDHEHADTPFKAVAFGPRLPRALEGSTPGLAIDDLRTFGVRAGRPAANDRITRAFEALYDGTATGVLANSSAEGFEAVAMLKQANPEQYTPANGAQYPAGKLGLSMKQIAQLIRCDVGLRIAFADVSGWDTHVNQGADQGQLARRLEELGQALGAFATDLGERMSDVVVLTMSEFGRTVNENGSAGTDHGHGTAMLAFGGDVQGGRVLGKWPGLAPEALHEGRDLAVTTDFRDLFGEVAAGHLGLARGADLFPGYALSPARRLGVFGRA